MSRPSPYTSTSTPCMVTLGAMALRSMVMRSAMKVEVSSFVHMSVRSYLRAVSVSSGRVSMPWQRYDGTEVEAHEAFERFAALFGVEALQIRTLDSADELQPLGVEVVIEARELQRRAVHICGAHAHGSKSLAACNMVRFCSLAT